MSMMFEPVRGGTRGGQAEFKWTDVSADKDRENYLGHSINAPTGRWQKNKDVHWYGREVDSGAAEREEEIRKIKEAEAEALSVALGFGPTKKTITAPDASPSASTTDVAIKSTSSDAQRLLEKEAKRQRKAERKEEKRAKKERRRLERSGDYDDDDIPRPHRRDWSRSRSPPRHRTIDQDVARSRYSRLPRTRSVSPSARQRRRHSRDRNYDASRREQDRESDRRRWDANSRRDRQYDLR